MKKLFSRRSPRARDIGDDMAAARRLSRGEICCVSEDVHVRKGNAEMLMLERRRLDKKEE